MLVIINRVCAKNDQQWFNITAEDFIAELVFVQ